MPLLEPHRWRDKNSFTMKDAEELVDITKKKERKIKIREEVTTTTSKVHPL